MADGDKASHFIFPHDENQFTVNYNDVLVVSWASSYEDPYLHFWGFIDPSSNDWQLFLNASVNPTGSYTWSFANNVSSIVSWPLAGHFDLGTKAQTGVPNLQAGNIDITSTNGSPTTYTTATSTSSTSSSSTTSTLSSNSSSTAALQSDGLPASTSSSSSSSTALSSSSSGTASSSTSLASGLSNSVVGGASPSTVTAVQTVMASLTSSPTPQSGPSTGTKAGIGVGVTVGVLLVIAAGALFFRRYQRIRSRRFAGGLPWRRKGYPLTNMGPPTEMSGENSIKELPADGQIRELPAESISGKLVSRYR
ncbi:hypothetical protein EV356DRAFT_566195 [Viridothelium virens]|uniref:Mid2 domain-containing protein n=1 Tax=Viridothelium virens TaxID=1048519 RepID=A0A6A6HBR4_VIRVR|nr:hypothetical protein EV356DRAFT_566195 [Viridothelium virens]